MNVHLVIGASGLVGEQLLVALERAGHSAVGTCFRQQVPGLATLDVREPPAVLDLIDTVRPAVIYLPASLTNVDECERDPSVGYAVNVAGVVHVVRAARQIGATVVYFSSDYVFDGQRGPYREDDPARPICEYGREKLLAEHYLALHAPGCLIIRTTVVYGWERQGKNFVARLIERLQQARRLRAPTDQIGNPTLAPDLARAAVDLVRAGAAGVYHVAGRERVDRYRFAVTAARAFGLDTGLIEPASTADLGQIAPRPLDAGLVVEKAEQILGRPLVAYEEGLRAMARAGAEQP